MTLALADLEQAFLDRLQPMPLTVELFPARPQDYRLTHPKGAILVAYGGSDFTAPTGLGTVVQDRTVRFNVVLMVRNLRTHAESLPWLDALRGLLTGFIPVAGASPVYPLREAFLQEDDGVWSWDLTLAFMIPNVAPDEIDVGVLLQHITTLDGMEQVDVEKTDDVITITETPRDSEICVNTE